jgi:dephospho-CoA kinase
MMIEFTGMIGSGKSTLARVLEQLLQDQNVMVLSPDRAVRRCVERSWIWKMIGRALPAAWRGRVFGLVLRAIMIVYKLAFALQHPDLVRQVWAAQLHREIPWWHRRLIVRLFFDVAGTYQFLRRRLSPDEVVLFEEGLVHRAINVYAWEPRQLDPAQVMAYLRKLPPSDLVVLVQAPYELCVERAATRGLPLRLRDKDQQVIDRFLRHAAEIVATAAAFLVATGRPMIEIDNAGTLEDGALRLREYVEHGELSVPVV